MINVPSKFIGKSKIAPDQIDSVVGQRCLNWAKMGNTIALDNSQFIADTNATCKPQFGHDFFNEFLLDIGGDEQKRAHPYQHNAFARL